MSFSDVCNVSFPFLVNSHLNQNILVFTRIWNHNPALSLTVHCFEKQHLALISIFLFLIFFLNTWIICDVDKQIESYNFVMNWNEWIRLDKSKYLLFYSFVLSYVAWIIFSVFINQIWFIHILLLFLACLWLNLNVFRVQETVFGTSG